MTTNLITNQQLVSIIKTVSETLDIRWPINPSLPEGPDGFYARLFNCLPKQQSNKLIDINGETYTLMKILARSIEYQYIPVVMKPEHWDSETGEVITESHMREYNVRVYEEEYSQAHTLSVDDAYQEYVIKTVDMPILTQRLSTEEKRTPFIALMEFALAGLVPSGVCDDILYNKVLTDLHRFVMYGFIKPKKPYVYPTTVKNYDLYIIHERDLNLTNSDNGDLIFLMDVKNKRLHYMGYIDLDNSENIKTQWY